MFAAELLKSEVSRSEVARRALNIQLDKLRFASQNQDKKVNHVSIETVRSEEMIASALKNEINCIDHATCEPGEEDAFFVCDLGKVERLLQLWQQQLPRVHPYYAVKCNPDTEVLRLLASYGVNFDCASKGEIETILDLGVDASRIVYAHPCKVSSSLRFAKKNEINLTTFDNADELYKMKKFHPECKLLLRIITDDSSAQCQLSTKYGAPLESVPELLQIAKDLGLEIAGVSFHVGSGASDTTALIKAVRDARGVFDLGAEFGFDMNVLDVGGGFSASTFIPASNALRSALDTFFPSTDGVNIIAEPGRYFVANAFTLATHVIAKRAVDDKAMVYVNDGVYGNLNCILFDHQEPEARVLSHGGEFLFGKQEGKHTVSLWGPTCDGLDCIAKETKLSRDVSVGDWIYFPDLGAYTSAAASPFNGFEANARKVYINSERV